MRHLLYYKLTNDFIADQTDVGGDGTKVVSVVNSVARCADTRKIYYRESGDLSDVFPCTVTVHFKWQGLTIAPDEVVNAKRYTGKSAKVCLQPKMVEGYTPAHKSYTLTVSGDTEYTFEYNNNYQSVPLTFEIMSGGTIIWKKESNNSPEGVIEYSLNGGNWIAITSTTIGSQISVSDGDIVQFRGNNASYSSSGSQKGNIFSGTCTFNIKGNIMSLINKTEFSELDTLVSAYTFYHLFKGNTGIVSAKSLVLPAATLVEACYECMFEGCARLTTAPELPATTLAKYCYYSMFNGCTSLVTAPELPATTLATDCYYAMFSECTSLTTAPELPATTLTEECYEYMFRGCASLTSVPALPATTLAGSCYGYMFQGCTGLASAPELPATTLKSGCYAGMFYNCQSLTSAPELPATTLAQNCYYRMFYNCTSLTSVPAILPATKLATQSYYGMFYNCTSLTSAPALPATTLAVANCCYQYMFQGCTSLTTAPELPATTLASNCYGYMFEGCTGLTSAPATLPATTLTNSCYYRMFYNCTSLTSVPPLPATILADYCYSYMFHGCTSLTSAPATLPATTLKAGCYQCMFQGCTSLTTAPELPATTLAVDCYYQMFQSCSNLNYIKCLATDASAGSCTTNWVNGVSSTGTFVKDANMSSWTRGNSGIPNNWTVQDA